MNSEPFIYQSLITELNRKRGVSMLKMTNRQRIPIIFVLGFLVTYVSWRLLMRLVYGWDLSWLGLEDWHLLLRGLLFYAPGWFFAVFLWHMIHPKPPVVHVLKEFEPIRQDDLEDLLARVFRLAAKTVLQGLEEGEYQVDRVCLDEGVGMAAVRLSMAERSWVIPFPLAIATARFDFQKGHVYSLKKVNGKPEFKRVR